jgi:SAM-dependent methyltransferase
MANRSQVPNPADIILQLASGYMASACLSAVTQLKIADLLRDGPRPVSELARNTSTSEDMLYRVLRALASVGVFIEIAPRTFGNTPTSDLLRTDHQASVHDMVRWMSDDFHFDTYRDMLPTLRDGKTALEHIHNMQPFDVIFANPERARIFNNAMTCFSSLIIPTVLNVYDFGPAGTLADIAGGHGLVLTTILQKYPQLKGILFDLPDVIAGAKNRIEKLGLSNRIQTVEGDFFEGVPAADHYVMKHIIHDWDDERAIRILKNCAQHLKPGGKVILLEAVVASGNEPQSGKWMDIEMLMLPGGKERTESEFRDLFARAGLQLTRIVPTESPICVVESQKM